MCTGGLFGKAVWPPFCQIELCLYYVNIANQGKTMLSIWSTQHNPAGITPLFTHNINRNRLQKPSKINQDLNWTDSSPLTLSLNALLFVPDWPLPLQRCANRSIHLPTARTLHNESKQSNTQQPVRGVNTFISCAWGLYEIQWTVWVIKPV